jgi:hypothetical protein
MFMGISRHPGPVDVAALRPLLHAAQATLAAAKITAGIGTALSGAGYASDANFTAGCGPELYVAVTKDARQAGRLTGGKTQHRQRLLAKDGRQARSFPARRGFLLPRRPIQAVLNGWQMTSTPV